jgi:hypothetical protein
MTWSASHGFFLLVVIVCLDTQTLQSASLMKLVMGGFLRKYESDEAGYGLFPQRVGAYK